MFFISRFHRVCECTRRRFSMCLTSQKDGATVCHSQRHSWIPCIVAAMETFLDSRCLSLHGSSDFSSGVVVSAISLLEIHMASVARSPWYGTVRFSIAMNMVNISMGKSHGKIPTVDGSAGCFHGCPLWQSDQFKQDLSIDIG